MGDNETWIDMETHVRSSNDKRAGIEVQKFNKLQMMIVAQMFKLARLPAFWQTPVIGSAF